MEFVDRKTEIERLRRILNGESPCLVIVRGRRRLGKSTLIKRVLTDDDIYYEADKTDASNQRSLLANVASLAFSGLDAANYPAWEALHLDAVETIEEYALWGGVPRYWVLREKSGDKDKALRENVLSSQGILYEEPQRLFNDDLNDIVKISTIMSLVGKGATRLKEIAARCEEPATNLSRPIGKLIDLGYIERDIPFGESTKSTKRSLYRIADPFLSFHFRFVAPMRSFIELERYAPVDAILKEQMSNHIGGWWEKICRDAVSGNFIDGIMYGEARRWWGSVIVDGKPQDVELDVVAESIDRKSILIGECKWSVSENARLMTAKLSKIAEQLHFTKDKNVVIKLFLKNNVEEPQGNHFLAEDVIKLY